MMRKWSAHLKKWFAEVSDIPEDVMLGVPRLTLIGQFRLSIENYQSVLSFSKTELKLALNEGELHITGNDFVLETILEKEIVLQGRVTGVRFENE
ncbi:stage IV sporulation protein [Sporolactobacillus inulinus CASD]|uniref:Stage IV sporulation protein n=4 Tax=Sporolactobacillus TaxID=2077 RepID=A0A0U1QNJ2_9BACL|nr:stage IV sporulation protein [Sporolactobacillus inulinus CASD]QAA24049.1 sporulation protein YqfC [Sporolactobacillus terrae]QAA27017.1 sporulation protein YqfC [Sporolactobacillus terrae]UAK17944.1 sporulation protein YqfC [Sporolactobacillus terrae]